MSVVIEIKCPCKNCGERIGYPPDMCGKQINCPHCNRVTMLMVPEIDPGVMGNAAQINAQAAPVGGAVPPPADDSVRQTVRIDKSALATPGEASKAAPPPGPGQSGPPPGGAPPPPGGAPPPPG